MNMRPSDLHFLCRCVTSGSWCTRCVCPQNQTNEITSVPERLLMAIKPGGCGRLDKLIDRSAEEEEEEQPGEY